MKHQLQTIREFVESAHEGEWASYVDRDAALSALSELERTSVTAGQEPFAHYVYFPDQQRGEFAHDLDDLCEDMTNDENHEVTPLYTAAPVAQQPQADQHPDDAAVGAFAAAMKEKLKQARAKGRGGWQTCPPEELSRMLREHVEKGDPRDVANFCMFLWSLGAGIAKQPQAEAVPFNHATQLQIAYVKGLGDGAMQGQAVPGEVVRDAVVAEREACAVLAQQFASQVGDLAWGVAAAIRARRDAAPQRTEAVPVAWDNCRAEYQCRSWCGNSSCVSHAAQGANT